MPFKPALTRVAEDPVRVIVSGSEFTEWHDVDMDSDVFTPADGFALTGTVPTGKLDLFREGSRVDVLVGEDRQMAGVIDDVEIDIGRDASRVSIAGRDLAAYLVDSEAKAERFSHYTLIDLAKHLLQPSWGIRNVLESNDANRKVQLGKKEKERFKAGRKPTASTLAKQPRTHTKIDPGQSVRQILDEHCMRAGVMWWLTAQGDLYIGKPQYEQDPIFEFFLYSTSSTQRKSNNVLSARVKRSIADRYSEIVVVGESSADASGKPNIFDPTDDEASATPTKPKRAKKYRGVATDPDLVKRGITRRLILTDNDALSDEMCTEKAKEQMGRRRLSALTISITVDGFKQYGRLFTADCLAYVKFEEAGIDGVFWISQRKFSEKRQERRTSLTLHEAGVYLA